MKGYHIVGPSGAGKTTALARLGADFLTFDLDIVGTRVGDDWKSWYIPHEIYQILADREWAKKKKRQVIAGCDSDADGMAGASRAAGFEMLLLLPTTETLISNRRQRGDKPVKVAESGESVSSWTQHGEKLGLPEFTSVDEIVKYIKGK